MISIEYRGKLYNIPEELFETRQDSYKRAWYISKNMCREKSFKEMYSQSMIFLNKNKGMKYDII
jgi:hypothetical protein